MIVVKCNMNILFSEMDQMIIVERITVNSMTYSKDEKVSHAKLSLHKF